MISTTQALKQVITIWEHVDLTCENAHFNLGRSMQATNEVLSQARMHDQSNSIGTLISQIERAFKDARWEAQIKWSNQLGSIGQGLWADMHVRKQRQAALVELLKKITL